MYIFPCISARIVTNPLSYIAETAERCEYVEPPTPSPTVARSLHDHSSTLAITVRPFVIPSGNLSS